ncbi:MAG: methanogenesis marker 3 protein [Halobacteriota archaeon]|nr:methanogenesis marker 3 protein [Halobacteriota archaeon]
MIEVTVNGVVTEVNENLTIGEVIRELDPNFTEDVLMGRIRGKKDKTGTCVFKTSRGRFITDIKDPLAFKDLRVSWITDDMIVFGPIPLKEGIKTIQRDVKRKDGDIFLLRSDSESYLGIALSDHEESSAVLEGEDTDVIGRIEAGLSVARKLSKEDYIKEINLEYEAKNILEKVSAETPATQGAEILSHVSVDLFNSAPESVEVLFSYLKNSDHKITITDSAKAFIRSECKITKKIPYENNRDFRKKGDLLVRNVGERINSIYFYKSDHMPQPSMNKIGKVTSGLELVEVAKDGDKLLVHTNPNQLFVLGKTQKEAEELLRLRGISQIREGDESDDAIVIKQAPSKTMNINGTLTTEGIAPESLVRIKFFREEAPVTIEHVFEASGLYSNYPIGKFKVMSSSEALILFETEGKKKAIVHENLPEKGGVGLLGMTNMSRQWYGLLGVRFEESEDYGPTGEELGSTNIIGKIVEGMEELKKLEAGSTFYFMEVS